MAKPLVLVILVAASEAQQPSTRAIEAAAQEALETNTVILLRFVEDPASDAEARRIEEAVAADAIAVVTWPTAERAHLHVLPTPSASWTDRDLAFAPSDALPERGRFVGFALASMIAPRREPVLPPTQAPEATPSPPTAVLSPPREAQARRGSFDLVVMGSVGVAGYAAGFGSEGSLRWHAFGRFHVRAGTGLRIGHIEPARADTSSWKLDAGLSWEAVRSEGAQPLTAGLRLDVLALRQALSRTIDADVVSRDARWLGGFDVLLEGAWEFAREGAFVVGIGSEVVSGTTRVVVDDVSRATIPKVRGVAELGVRARF